MHYDGLNPFDQVDCSITQNVRNANLRSPETKWQEVRSLIEELSAQARASVEPQEFFLALLHRLNKLLTSMAMFVWVENDRGFHELCHLGLTVPQLFRSSLEQAQHQIELQKLRAQPQPTPVRFALTDPESTARRHCFLLLCPVSHEHDLRAVVEVIVDAHDGDVAQDLLIVSQLCGLAEEFFERDELRRLRSRQLEAAREETFCRVVHSSIRLDKTAHNVANEGRWLIECDRISVAILLGHRAKVLAVSGQDVVHKRSSVIGRMERLISQVSRYGVPVASTEQPGDLPPDVSLELQAYLTESHAKFVTILPLGPESSPQTSPTKPEESNPIAPFALILEEFGKEQLSNVGRDRLVTIVAHARTALHNALRYENLLPFSWWESLGDFFWTLKTSSRRKFAMVTVILLGMTLALIYVPADFELEARGSLQPVVRRRIFAGSDGVVERILVAHGDSVEEGALLVSLQDADLEYRLSGVIGELQTTAKKLAAIRTTRLDKDSTATANKARSNDAAAEEAELTEWLNNLDRQRTLLLQQQEQLKIRSPMRGQVLTWDTMRSLSSKPVARGETLLEIADLEGAWELEVQMPESRMGHLSLAVQANAPNQLPVTFLLATEPNAPRQGTVREITLSAEASEKDGNTVLVKVAFDSNSVSLRRPGAEVVARVYCGKRSLGFVWFHELIEFVQSRLLFRI